MPSHQITAPLNLDPFEAIQQGDKYYAEVDGRPDDASQFLQIVEVYGKVFAKPSQVPRSNAADLQTQLEDLIAKKPTNGCVVGSAVNTAGGVSYRFRHKNGKSIPVAKINSDQNFLQVWVKFRGQTDYVMATTYVQLNPESP